VTLPNGHWSMEAEVSVAVTDVDVHNGEITCGGVDRCGESAIVKAHRGDICSVQLITAVIGDSRRSTTGFSTRKR
jgi:hypothetical protein